MLLMDLWRKIFLNEGLATVIFVYSNGLTIHSLCDDLPLEKYEIMMLDGTMAGESAPQRAAQYAAAVAGNRRALRNPEPAGAGDAGDVFSPRERGGQMKSAVKPPPEVV